MVMFTTWYVKVGAKEHGPYLPSQLKRLAEEGKVSPESEVRRGTDGSWVRARRVKGLFPVTTPTPDKAAINEEDVLDILGPPTEPLSEAGEWRPSLSVEAPGSPQPSTPEPSFGDICSTTVPETPSEEEAHKKVRTKFLRKYQRGYLCPHPGCRKSLKDKWPPSRLRSSCGFCNKPIRWSPSQFSTMWGDCLGPIVGAMGAIVSAIVGGLLGGCGVALLCGCLGWWVLCIVGNLLSSAVANIFAVRQLMREPISRKEKWEEFWRL
jgi:hypothetical protein